MFGRFLDYAVLLVSSDANPQVYEEIRKDTYMGHVWEELMKDVIEERLEDSWIESIKNIMQELKYTSDQAMDLLKIPQSSRESLVKRL